MEELGADQHRSEEDGRHDAHPQVVGRVLHPGHQRDDETREHRQQEALQAHPELGVVQPRLAGHGREVGPSPQDHPDHQGSSDDVAHEGDDPEPGQTEPRTLLGDRGGDGDQEVLGEQLAAGHEQRHEADREGEPSEDLVPGRGLDDEVGQHPHADVDPAEQTRRDQRAERARETLAALLHEPLEGLVELCVRLFLGLRHA